MSTHQPTFLAFALGGITRLYYSEKPELGIVINL